MIEQMPIGEGGEGERSFEVKKEEAFGLYIEFITALNEYQELKGDGVEDVTQASLEEGFRNDIENLKDEDWGGYVEDLRKRAKDLNSEIAELKKQQTDATPPSNVEGKKETPESQKREVDTLDIGEITTDLPPDSFNEATPIQGGDEIVVRSGAEKLRGEVEGVEGARDLDLESIFNRIEATDVIKFVNVGGEDIDMTPASAIRNIERLIEECEKFDGQIPATASVRQEKILSVMRGFSNHPKLLEDLFNYFEKRGWLKKDLYPRRKEGEKVGVKQEEERPDVGVEKERTDLPLKTRYEPSDIAFGYEEDISHFLYLKPGTLDYESQLYRLIGAYFVIPSLKKIGVSDAEGPLLSESLLKLIFLHNKVDFPENTIEGANFEKLEDFASFRKARLDSIKVGDGVFGDFSIKGRDIEYIFMNAERLLNKKIEEAKKQGGEIEEPERPEESKKPPVVIPSASSGELDSVVISPEDVRRKREEILSGGRRRSGTLERAVEVGPAESEPTLRDVRREQGKSWHKWVIPGGGLAVVAGGLLLLSGDKEAKKTEESDPGMTPSASTNRIEHIEGGRTNAPVELKGAEVVAMERGLTNYVSPLYLAKLHLADGLKVLPNAPIVSGFEQIDPDLADNLKVIWSDENGFYPKGWVSGKFLAINYSTGQDTNTLQRYGTNVTGKVVGTYNQATRSLNFYTNSNFEVKLSDNKLPSNLAPKALDDVFSHEVGHANDWISNFNLPYEKRLALLDSIIGRLNSDDRIKFSYVESIDKDKFDLKAEEYWAELCSMYFRSPKNLKEKNPKDFAIVDGVVEETCNIADVPKFNPLPPSQAKYEVARNWETRKEGVTLLHGGLTTWQDYMNRVVRDLKGIGGKPTKFDAFTETPFKN